MKNKTVYRLNRSNRKIETREIREDQNPAWSIETSEEAERKLAEFIVKDNARIRVYNKKRAIVEAEFREKLQVFLEENGATIGFSVSPGSDTHGLYDEMMVACVKVDGVSYDLELCHGWEVDSSDLND